MPLHDDEPSLPVAEVLNSPSKSSGKGILLYKPYNNLTLCSSKASVHCYVYNYLPLLCFHRLDESGFVCCNTVYWNVSSQTDSVLF